jgi:UDP-2-acetamido-3-amino-2,3-dideoxy-glucuronate N-acetyltransferase
MIETVKVAVTGAGYWGKKLVRSLYELGYLKSVCDSNPVLLNDLRKTYPDILITSDYKDLLKDKEIKGVLIALLAEMHFDFTKQAILSGKDVFVEKPLALKLTDAKELIRLAEKNKKILMVGHLLHYHSGFSKLKEIVRSGEIGKVRYIYSSRLSTGKIRAQENVIWSFAPHDISMMLSLVESKPESIFVKGHCIVQKNIEDIATINLEFVDNIKSHIFVSWLNPFKRQEFTVICEKKMIVFDDTKSWEEKLQIYPHEVFHKDGLTDIIKKKPVKIFIATSEPLKDECSHFIECIKNRQKPLTDGYEGFRVLEVLDIAQKSLNSGKVEYF